MELKEVLVKIEESKKVRKQVEMIPITQVTGHLDGMFGEINRLQCDLALQSQFTNWVCHYL